jgi:hypothetical protein
MRRTLAVVLAVLSIAPGLPARTKHDWDNVMKLKSGAPVLILLWNGDWLDGRIETVTDAELQLDTSATANARTGWRQPITRASIRRIVRLREHESHVPSPNHLLGAGALIGGVTGITIGAIADAKGNVQGKWILDGFAGALLGFFGAGVVAAAVGIAGIAHDSHHHRIIYEDAGPRPASSLLQAERD